MTLRHLFQSNLLRIHVFYMGQQFFVQKAPMSNKGKKTNRAIGEGMNSHDADDLNWSL